MILKGTLIMAMMLTMACAPKQTTDTAQGSKGSAPEDEAPTLDILGGCKADGLKRFIGKPLTAALAEQMKKEAGASIVRTGHENGVMTMDFNSGRLNIFHNDAKAIVRVDCG
jgi:hypothetical protein